MDVGEQVAFDQVHESATRGGTFYAEYDAWRNTLFDSSCRLVERGDGINLADYTLSIEVEIDGTEELPLGAEVVKISNGSAVNGGRFSVRIPPAVIERAFVDGAYESLTFYVEGKKPGVDLPLLCGVVSVRDSAGRV